MLSAPGTRTWTRFALVVCATMVIVALAVPARAASLTQTWAERYLGGTDFQYARSLAVSPDGKTVYVTGISAGPVQEGDPYDAFATIAYDAATGETIWLDRFSDAGIDNWATTVVVSPDGRQVYVTGVTPDGYPIVAYDAQTGERLWVAHAPESGVVGFIGWLAVSPNSRLVYFTGEVELAAGSETGMTTMALRASTGGTVWSSTLQDPRGLQVRPAAIAVDTKGHRVFVTGSAGQLNTYPTQDAPDYATVAYQARSGSQLWAQFYDGPGSGADDARAVAVTPDGRRVVVAGSSGAPGGMPQYALIEYRAADGETVWVSRDGSASQWRSLRSLVIARNGRTGYVTGTESEPFTSGDRYRTVSFSVATGQVGWSSTFAGESVADAAAMAMSPDGMYLYVTGTADDGTRDTYATLAYVASTGQQIALAWYDAPEGVSAGPEAIGVSASGDIFVTGRGGGAFATVAYALT